MKLYEIATELQQLYIEWNALDAELHETEDMDEKRRTEIGTRLGQVEGDIQALDLGFETKVENVAKLVRNLQAECEVEQAKADGFWEEYQRYASRVKRIDHKVVWLKQYMLHQMQRVGIEEVKGEDLKVKRYQNSQPRVEAVDATLVPPELWIHLDPKLDKQEVIARWRAGEVVPGTKIERGEHVRIR